MTARPTDLEAWSTLEALGAARGNAAGVAATYRKICFDKPELSKVIGLRAVQFHDDWGEDPATVAELVERMFAASPDAQWALDRLKLTLSSESRWNDLLGVFDTALGGATSEEAKRALLEDAARVAKDFARDPDRAIAYSERLYAISRDDRVRTSLEKLYEKCGRHESLIAFYAAELPALATPAAQALRAKMAGLWLTVGDADRAFAVIEEMLAENPEEPAAFELLERIFAAPPRPGGDAAPPSSAAPRAGSAPRSTRQRAALLLKPHYVALGRARDLVRVLQVELAVATNDTERAATYRELVDLELGTLQDDAGAMFALAALVVIEPHDESHRRSLAEVSARLGRVDRRVKVLMTAADRTVDVTVRASLLLEAAAVSKGPLAAAPRAIDLYQRVLAIADLPPATQLVAARELSPLLAEAGRIAERCAVLERLASVETDPALRRAALGEVARIASTDFGDTERAIGAWRARLADDAGDADAINGMRAALASQNRWRELTAVLEQASAAAPAMRAELLLEAATIEERDLADVNQAIRLFEALLAHTPDDASVMERLATLYKQQARHAELLRLRRRQVELATDATERIRLRLDIASVLEETGNDVERVTVLEANLEDDPRNAATVASLGAALESLGRYEPLTDLWERQAAASDAAGDKEAAATFWGRAGALSEHRLADAARAISAHEKAGQSQASLDALARLYSQRDKPLDAAIALERLLPLTSGEDRLDALLRLAAAYVAGGRRDSARRRLEEAADRDTDARVRAALAVIYRSDEAWGPLADLLVAQARSTTDETDRVDLLVEAAELFQKRRSDPASAIPLVEEALAIVARRTIQNAASPPGRALTVVSVSLMLAEALVLAGRGEEATVLLQKRIEEFGARRPRERGLVHHAQSRVLLALGRSADALAELEAAVKIDPLNLSIRRALADSTRDAGDLEGAQRIYRALLLVVPRQENGPPAEIARSEVLICLADIAERLEDAAEATECFESALAAARENESERVAAERELGARGKHTVLAELLLERLDVPDADVAAAACDRLATIYEEHLDRREDALAMRLRALSITPLLPARHAAALALAKALGSVGSYLDLVSAECVRAKTPEAVYDLRSLLAAAFEEEGELELAAAELEQAERAALEVEPHAVGGRRLDRVWKSLEGIYRRLGDDAARAPVLERRAEASEARQEPAADRAELYYELASLRLGKAETQSVGLDILSRAVSSSAEPDRAEAALLAALEVDRTNERALRMYESLSRGKGRERALIDALQRLGSLPNQSASLLEASEVAQAIGDGPLSESLLRRYVDSVEPEPAERSEGSAPEIAKALLALSVLREGAGDVRESAALKERAAARLDKESARPILLEVAALASGPLADRSRAAGIYESLLADDPTDRRVWEPLIDAYRALGDVTALAGLVDAVAPLLDEPTERARLRLEEATLLLRSAVAAPPTPPPSEVVDDDDWGPVRPSQWPKSLRPPGMGSIAPAKMTSRPPHASRIPPGTERAERALWKVLDDDAGSAEAIAMLTSIFERGERLDDLAKLIGRQLDAARKSGDSATAASFATRLGALREECGRDEEAAQAFRNAVELDPTNRAAHRALMRLSEKRQDPREVAGATAVLLELEVGTEAERLALRLATILEGLGDAADARHALEMGIERCPESQALRERLVESFRKAGEWQELVAYHVAAAETRGAVADRVEELRLAAGITRRELSDPAGAAAILERALELAPDDRNVLLLLINCWSSAGDHARAIAAVDTALIDGPEDQESLFHMRAVLHETTGAREEALADLETAFTLSGGAYGEELAAALEGFVGRPEGADRQELRMRLVEILHGLERFDDACAHLEEILRRDSDHRDARAILAALDARAGRVEEAIESYRVLLALEEGETLVNVTLAFADVCEEHDRTADLVPALERAAKAFPTHVGLTRRLQKAYEKLGDNQALAGLVLEDAARENDPSKKFDLLASAARLLIDPDKGDPSRAMGVLAEARELRPDDPDIGILLVDALIASAKSGEALDLLEQLVAGQKRRSKARSQMHSRMADLYTRMGAQMGALQSLVKAMDDDPHDAALAMRTGLAAVELNDLDAVTRAFRTVTLMKTVPLGVTEGGAPSAAKCIAYYHLARVAQRQGDPRKARLMIEKSLGEAPTPEARALRDSLKG